MKTYIHFLLAVLFALPVACGQQDALRATAVADDGVEVLTRGPVHEAFAETIVFDPEAGVVVPKEAPDPIEELPPEQKPEGANVEWIPGYWGWDDERNDFLWVSGIWRAVPPGRQWVPGYWGKSARGFQWTSGYWANAEESEIEYLPEPPQSLEAGPNRDAPSADHVWVPGCWVWHQSRYAWRPGYWVITHPNWIWVPAHYVWAPCGYVFVDGYYDYLPVRRGVLFAPVIFKPSIYARRDFHYSPVTVINLAAFTNHLFLRPTYRHYYFGDYYDTHYVSSGFSPWFSFSSSRQGYDPFYAYERRHHRNDREWDRKVAMEFAHRREREEARPPRTWADQRERSRRDATTTDRSLAIAVSFDEMTRSDEIPIRLKPVARDERQFLGQRGKEVRLARETRQKVEAESVAPSRDASVRPTKSVKAKLAKTSIVAKSAERVGKDDAPPQAIEAPPPDLSVEPGSKAARSKAEATSEPRVTKGEPRLEPASTEPRVAEPKATPKGPLTESRPARPDAEPKPERPKAEPKGPVAEPEPPVAEPRPVPKTRPKGPVAEPRPERPDAEPKPERPKTEAKAPVVEPEPPVAEPRPERPKARPKGPVAEPRPERPDAEPKPERPKTEAKGPVAEPQPDKSKTPKAKSEAPSSAEPQPERPKAKGKASKLEPELEEPKLRPKQKQKLDQPKTKKGGSDDKPKVDAKDRSKDKPKVDPKEESKDDKDKPPKDKSPT